MAGTLLNQAERWAEQNLKVARIILSDPRRYPLDSLAGMWAAKILERDCNLPGAVLQRVIENSRRRG